MDNIIFIGALDNPNAIIIRKIARVDGIRFFSPSNFSQQLGLMSRPKGYKVPLHRHNEVERKILNTQEVLIMRNGSCLIHIYGETLEEIESIILNEGDVILLAHGAHSIEMLQDSEILEVKQGPYAGDNDKTILNLEKP